MSQKRALAQEISPRKRVGSGDETRNNPTAPNTNSIICPHTLLLHLLYLLQELEVVLLCSSCQSTAHGGAR